MRTPKSTLVLEISRPGAVVQVLDESGDVRVERDGGDGNLSISIAPGRHEVRVRKHGYELFAERFEIDSGAEKTITVELQRRQARLPRWGPQAARKKWRTASA